jgi:hypothetical protein
MLKDAMAYYMRWSSQQISFRKTINVPLVKEILVSSLFGRGTMIMVGDMHGFVSGLSTTEMSKSSYPTISQLPLKKTISQLC